MLKILYAAGNSFNSRIQLQRFLQSTDNKYIIKIAAYKKSSPINTNIDWTLDCLLNIFKPDLLSLDNDNFQTYYQQIKYFNPDLIISDMEYYSSYIANVLNITLWQCSSLLINYAVKNKYNLGLSKNYAHILHSKPIENQRYINIIHNSNCNFVYSHFGDLDSPPILKEGFEWIRPYHSVGKHFITCKHNLVAAMYGSNKKVLSLLKKYDDSVYFTNCYQENYPNILLKDIDNEQEYFCNLKNSSLFICEGQTSFLADAFYNGKYSVVLPNYNDIECIVNSTFSKHYNLSTSIYNCDDDISLFINKDIKYDKKDIKFLHERLEEI